MSALIIDDSEESRRAAQIVRDNFPDCRIRKAVADRGKLPLLIDPDGCVEGVELICGFLDVSVSGIMEVENSGIYKNGGKTKNCQ